MKPFRFSLQSIRALKEQAEQTARERYAAALRACEQAAARLQQAIEELTECHCVFSGQLAAGAISSELLRTRAWCNVLESRVKERVETLEKARRSVEAVLKDLMIATRERESLDRLHDRRRAEYDHQFQAAEQKALDEVALQLIHSPAALRVLTKNTES